MAILSDITVPFAEGLSIKENLLAQHRFFPPNDKPNTLRVFIVREPFDDFYHLVLDNGQTEELDEEATRIWLEERGAGEDLINAGITQAWNFKSALIHIKNPTIPKQPFRPEAPKLNLV
ncbi:MAG: hypothetical protein ACOYB3_00745 [Azonexus sp.]